MTPCKFFLLCVYISNHRVERAAVVSNGHDKSVVRSHLGDSKAATTLAEDPVQKQVDATTQQAVAVARENQSGAQKTLGGVKDQISQA